LFLSSLLSLAKARTLYYVETNQSIPIVFTTVLCLKVVLLIVETIPKVSILKRDYRDSPPESTVGVLGECLFWWLNPLLLLGNRVDLTVPQLPKLDDRLCSTGIGENGLEKIWRNGKHVCLNISTGADDRVINLGKKSGHSLLWACFRYFSGPILLGILPRALQVGFTFAQPFLVDTTVTWIGGDDLSYTLGQGYALIGAFGIVYIGIAVSPSPLSLSKVLIRAWSILIMPDLHGGLSASSLSSGLHDASKPNRYALQSYYGHARCRH
jgi:hypothetical protein